MTHAIRTHWPEYLMEAACLGMFMLSACIFGVLLEHPASWINRSIDSATVRRVLMGLAMGATAVAIIHTPWGKRSGAHMNPAVTLTFWSLGKVRGIDALFYVAAQFAGGIAGMWLGATLIGPALGDGGVNYVVTAPGRWGEWIALYAEFAISLILMTTVLVLANTPRFSRLTPWAAGLLVASYISLEAPVSGMSMNPARTLGSAAWAGDYGSLWIYFVAPPLAMLLAGRLYRTGNGARRLYCAKFHHHNNQRCIFHCEWEEMGNA
jgi:aquaporin Z